MVRRIISLVRVQVLFVDMFLSGRHVSVRHHRRVLSSLLIKVLTVAQLVSQVHFLSLLLDHLSSFFYFLLGVSVLSPIILNFLLFEVLLLFYLSPEVIFLNLLQLLLLVPHVVRGLVQSLGPLLLRFLKSARFKGFVLLAGGADIGLVVLRSISRFLIRHFKVVALTVVARAQLTGHDPAISQFLLLIVLLLHLLLLRNLAVFPRHQNFLRLNSVPSLIFKMLGCVSIVLKCLLALSKVFHFLDARHLILLVDHLFGLLAVLAFLSNLLFHHLTVALISHNQGLVETDFVLILKHLLHL